MAQSHEGVPAELPAGADYAGPGVAGSDGFPLPVNLRVDEEQYWSGLGKQEIAFHQVLGELVDNAVSAAGRDRDGDPLPFTVEVTLERLGRKVLVQVADRGIGMSAAEVAGHVLSPGGKGRSRGDLNEHGFGLKNALCVLTAGNALAFEIRTRDAEAVQQDLYYRVRGPFSARMRVELDRPGNWDRGLAHPAGPTGTRVTAETTFDYFNTLYKKVRKDFRKLCDRLGEHLGVMYRGYLAERSNKIWLRWRDLGDDESAPLLAAPWEERRVPAILVPFDTGGCTESRIEVVGGAVAVYRRGLLDEGLARDPGRGWPYPLQIYYRGNIPSQGVDLVLGRRVLKTAQLPEVWDEGRHNEFNRFVGEIVLDRGFGTVNNKTAIDPNSPAWQSLLEELNDPDGGFLPAKVTRRRTEREIKERLIPILEASPGSRATMHRRVWSGSGVEIDLHHLLDAGREVHVYEVKAGTAEPLDAYQLLMYWDGVVRDDGKSPALARLVAKSVPPSVRNIICEINKRRDALGNLYKFEAREISSFGLE